MPVLNLDSSEVDQSTILVHSSIIKSGGILMVSFHIVGDAISVKAKVAVVKIKSI